MSGEVAADVWRELHAKVAETGIYPVICRDESCVDNIVQVLEDARSDGDTVESILSRATPENVRKYRDRVTNAAGRSDVDFDPTRSEFEPVEEEGDDEPETFENAVAVSATDFGEDFLDEVLMLHVPARNGWEAIASLAWGNFNACPKPEIIAAHLRDWHERYGAELSVVCDDTLECFTRRLPGTRDEAIELAMEMYIFCNDIVDQGTESIEALAAPLLVSHAWFFWWV